MTIGVADAASDGELPEALARQFRTRIEEPTLRNRRGIANAVANAIDPAHTFAPEIGTERINWATQYLLRPKEDARHLTNRFRRASARRTRAPSPGSPPGRAG